MPETKAHLKLTFNKGRVKELSNLTDEEIRLGLECCEEMKDKLEEEKNER